MGNNDEAAPSAGPHSVNDVLAGSPYVAVRPLGRGAMGEVVLAEHRALRKQVVVKLLHAKLAGDAHFVDRMRLEAQALASLSSPHLVQVTDSGVTPRGRPYFVMELLQGTVLREELRARGPLPVAEALEVTRQILLGLQVVHDARLVHRDVKLENVFYCNGEPGQRIVKLLDFGIVKVPASGAGVEPLHKPTDAGVAMGTPRYFAPEQALGMAVDARSDLYSVGVVLYTLLAGRGPFDDHKGLPNLIIAQVGERPSPPSRYSPQPIPPALDELVMRALEKRPDDRYAAASDFLLAIARIQRDFEPGASDAMVAPPADPLTDDSASTLPREAAARRWPSTERLPSDANITPRASRARFGTEEMPHVQASRLAPADATVAYGAGRALRPAEPPDAPASVARGSAPTELAPLDARPARSSRTVLVLVALGVLVGVVLTLALLSRAHG